MRPLEADRKWGVAVGLSMGTRPKLAWWKLSMPKLGLSYRFGDGISAVRVVFGEIF